MKAFAISPMTKINVTFLPASVIQFVSVCVCVCVCVILNL